MKVLRKVQGKVVSVTCKGVWVSKSFKNKEEATIVASLPGLSYHSGTNSFQATDSNGKVTSVTSILKNMPVTATTSTASRGRKPILETPELLEALAKALRSKDPVKAMVSVGYSDFSSQEMLRRIDHLRDSFSQRAK